MGETCNESYTPQIPMLKSSFPKPQTMMLFGNLAIPDVSTKDALIEWDGPPANKGKCEWRHVMLTPGKDEPQAVAELSS